MGWDNSNDHQLSLLRLLLVMEWSYDPIDPHMNCRWDGMIPAGTTLMAAPFIYSWNGVGLPDIWVGLPRWNRLALVESSWKSSAQ